MISAEREVRATTLETPTGLTSAAGELLAGVGDVD
jgi:hypothetical protein